MRLVFILILIVMALACSNVENKGTAAPSHEGMVSIEGRFWMDATEVTNSQFAEFVKATGYVTTAEKEADWNELKKQLPH